MATDKTAEKGNVATHIASVFVALTHIRGKNYPQSEEAAGGAGWRKNSRYEKRGKGRYWEKSREISVVCFERQYRPRVRQRMIVRVCTIFSPFFAFCSFLFFNSKFLPSISFPAFVSHFFFVSMPINAGVKIVRGVRRCSGAYFSFV